MGILLNPELERRIALKVESGQYHSADEVVQQGLDLLEARDAEQQPASAHPEPPIWETIIRLGQQIPEDELASIPTDLSINHDHYLYGAPKVEE